MSLLKRIWRAVMAATVDRATVERIRNLASTVDIIEQRLDITVSTGPASPERISRFLISNGIMMAVFDPQDRIEYLARKLSAQTGGCTMVTMVVGVVHADNCPDRPAGSASGYTVKGN